MSIAKFQRIIQGIVLPLLGVALIIKTMALHETFDPSTIVVIGGLLGFRWLGNGQADEK